MTASHRVCAGSVAFMLFLSVLMMGSACSGNDTAESSDDSTAGLSQRMLQDRGERYASSMRAYIEQSISEVNADQQLLERDPTGEARATKLAMLERAKARGTVSATDYESAWAGYKQCMLDRGYRQILLIKKSNGLYKEAGHEAGTEQQEKQYTQDMMDCGILHTSYVVDVYAAQQGNQHLYKNIYQGALDCMHREHLVADGYSLKDLDHDLYGDVTNEQDLKADIYGPKISSCLLANNITVGGKAEPTERLW